MDHYQDLRSEMAVALQAVGIEIEVQHHEVATARPGRDRHPVRHAAAHGRPADDVQVRPQERGLAGGQDGHLHAQADLRGQRLGHARAPVAVEGRRAAVLRRGGLRRSVRHGPLVHRRPAGTTPTRSSPSPTRRPTASSGWCPGYEAPVNLVYSQRNRSASCRIPLYSQEPEGQAHRVPLPRQPSATRTSPSRPC